MRKSQGFLVVGGAVTGAVLGSLATWFLDKRQGRRRRAVFKDRIRHYGRTGVRQMRVRGVDLLHRSYGRLAHLRTAFRTEIRHEQPSDDVLSSRIRSRLGHVASHSHAVEISCNNGRVTLKGPVLASAFHSILRGVESVPGVREVINQLTVYEQDMPKAA